jgi:hypothetical protein
MSNSAEAQALTLERFLEAWKKWDAQECIAVFANDFTQVTLPLSLGIPKRKRAQVEETFPALVATVKSYKVRGNYSRRQRGQLAEISSYKLTVRHVVHDVKRNKASVYALSEGTLPWGAWEVEYSVYITFSEAGDKVAVLEEMLDPTFMREFGPKFHQHLQDNGGPVAVAART